MTDTFGYGQQDPNDSASEFNKISFLVRQLVSQLCTMKLVEVVAVTGGGAEAGTGTVDVRPLVNQIDGNGNAVPHGTVYGLPWSRLQGGDSAVVVDPVVGDLGYVVASDRDISAVKSTRARANPGSHRDFDIADGIYAGAVLTVAPAQYLVFTEAGVRLVDRNGNSVVLSSTGTTITDSVGNVVSMAAGGITLTPVAPMPVTVMGNLIVQGNIELSGAFEAIGGGTYVGDLKTTGDVIAKFGTPASVGLSTHTHHQPNDSHGDTEQATNAPTGGT